MAVATAIRTERLRIVIQGAVQGVGFRPTIYRLATNLRLGGWVRNTIAGIEIEIEGSSERLEEFLLQLKAGPPRAAVVTTEEILRVAPSGSAGFEILPSEESISSPAPRVAAVLPDLTTCDECLGELFDPTNRRFGYPFTNCTLCGPRYTITTDIPYDRSNTTMQKFVQCLSCRQEYDSYQDRRFHAQPNACPVCGPSLRAWPPSVEVENPIVLAARALALGKIVALKGIGGFQLLVDARDSVAVLNLRERKHRDEKPFALLMPSIEYVRRYCNLSEAEEKLLLSQAAPIVLLSPKDGHDLAPEVAQSSPSLGVMLPCSPIHHLLMAEYPFALVATSGNLASEPIAIENEEAIVRLKNIADLFILHDRPIARACDDSVARFLDGPQILRRARGYAPLPVRVPRDLRPVLAVGGHLKNAVAIGFGRQVCLSQHVGDLDSLESREAFERTIQDLCRLYRFRPELIVSDLHPDYASTWWAKEHAQSTGIPHIQVQHHHAHLASCAAENGLEADYLGVAWDGAGLGVDGTIWGGEFFLVDQSGFERVAHLRQFSLPGGEAAMHDCSRPAAGLLWEVLGAERARNTIDPRFAAMLALGVNVPKSSSIGRLFDAVAYLSGAAQQNLFEGQAAMCLESAIGPTQSEQSYEIAFKNGIGDWAPLIEQVVADKQSNLDLALIATKFHNSLANWILEVACIAGTRQVVLSGGVFQNAYLTVRSKQLLESKGIHVFTHRQVPSNDGGLALGQAVLAGQIK